MTSTSERRRPRPVFSATTTSDERPSSVGNINGGSSNSSGGGGEEGDNCEGGADDTTALQPRQLQPRVSSNTSSPRSPPPSYPSSRTTAAVVGAGGRLSPASERGHRSRSSETTSEEGRSVSSAFQHQQQQQRPRSDPRLASERSDDDGAAVSASGHGSSSRIVQGRAHTSSHRSVGFGGLPTSTSSSSPKGRGKHADMDFSNRSFFGDLTRLPIAGEGDGDTNVNALVNASKTLGMPPPPLSQQSLSSSTAAGAVTSNKQRRLGRCQRGCRVGLLKFRLACGAIVEHPAVQVSVVALIVLNAIVMGVATFDFVTDNPKVASAFDTADTVFLSIFTVELVLQFLYRFFALFMDPWLVFDFLIVVTSWSLESLQVIRAFRSFRAFRLVTRITPLRDLIAAIGAVMPRIYAIMMLLLLVFYIFAVLFTELFGHLTLSETYFTTLEASLFTCMQFMTLSWSDVTRELMLYVPWAWLPVVSFIAVTGFIVFNLIVAVVCDAVAIVDRQVRADEEKDLLEEQKLEQEDASESDREILRLAQVRVWDLTTHVRVMQTRQEELLKAIAELSAQVLDAQVEASRALGVPLLDDSTEYDEEDDGSDMGGGPSGAATGGGGGRPSFDGGARTFQHQIDRVSARLERLRDPALSQSLAIDDLSLSADTPVSRRLSASSLTAGAGPHEEPQHPPGQPPPP